QLERGSVDQVIRVYDRAFRPLWPQTLSDTYFKLLTEEGRLHDFVAKARSALAANPANLNAAARLYHYHRHQNNPGAARRALLEFRLAKESRAQPWTADELL